MDETNVYHITYSREMKSASLYFYGCNFSCLGCIRRRYRYDIHLRPSRQGRSESRLQIDTILKILRKRDPIEKVILMGGEPTIDPSLTLLAARLKDEIGSYNILLTNGYIFPEIESIDEVCVGIKAYSEHLHREYTGLTGDEVFKNLAKFYREDITLRTESLFIPGYIDLDETERIVKAIARISPDIPHRIDAYIPVPGAEWRRPAPCQIEEVVKMARSYLKQVTSLTDTLKASRIVVLY